MVGNITKDSLGISFDGKFGSMRNTESFCIYPSSNLDLDKIMIQSEKRFGIITLSKNKLVLSTSRNNANSLTLQVDMLQGKAIVVDVTTEVAQIKEQIEIHYCSLSNLVL